MDAMVLYQIGRGSKDKNDTLGPSVTISSLPVVRNLMASLFIEVDAPVIKSGYKILWSESYFAYTVQE